MAQRDTALCSSMNNGFSWFAHYQRAPGNAAASAATAAACCAERRLQTPCHGTSLSTVPLLLAAHYLYGHVHRLHAFIACVKCVCIKRAGTSTIFACMQMVSTLACACARAVGGAQQVGVVNVCTLWAIHQLVPCVGRCAQCCRHPAGMIAFAVLVCSQCWSALCRQPMRRHALPCPDLPCDG